MLRGAWRTEGVDFSADAIAAPLLQTVDEAKRALDRQRGKVFRNKSVEAVVTGQTMSKAHAAQMSVCNLAALGFSEAEARRIHYSTCAKMHEIFEAAQHGFFEPNYDPQNKKGRDGAWHYFGVIDVAGYGKFDVNVSAIKPTRHKEDNKLFTLELTIENPSEIGSDTLSQRGRALRSEGFSAPRLSAYRSFVEKEMTSIKKNAQNNGFFMLAPNGEQTKLDEKQWLTVRTQAFKEWFGDWENDPKNASKAVDENGEVLVAYHGTDADFKAFDIGKAGKSTPYAGVGFWVSDLQGFGKAWAVDAPDAAGEPREMAVFLNLKHPKVYRTSPGKHGDAYEQFAADVAAEIGKAAAFANSGDEDAVQAAFREKPETAAKYRRRLEEQGYDGIVLKGATYDSIYAGDADKPNDQYIAFRSGLAKSATDNRGDV